MFIVSVYGGIGSQMDQYSFVKTLQHYYPSVDIKMTPLTNITMHNGYELGRVFGIENNFADRKIVKKLSEFPLSDFNFFEKIVFKSGAIVRKSFNLEKKSWIFKRDPSEFYPDLLTLDSNKNYLIQGNFSNPLYKKDIEEELKKCFIFKNKLDEHNYIMKKRMENENSISVHIRHGDYVSKEYNFPVCGLNYYLDAIKYIQKHIENPQFYFFSDDLEYVKINFNHIKNKTIVNWNRNENSYIDMQLMSSCKHNIIANSTFSFWGAWLNNYKEKIVINPDKHVDFVKYPITYPGWISLNSYMEYWNDAK